MCLILLSSHGQRSLVPLARGTCLKCQCKDGSRSLSIQCPVVPWNVDFEDFVVPRHGSEEASTILRIFNGQRHPTVFAPAETTDGQGPIGRLPHNSLRASSQFFVQST
jgi:hypothetical protein